MTVTAFFGTPEAAIPTLDVLATTTELRTVVTRPPRRRGRGSAPRPAPVHARALELELPVAHPADRSELLALPLDGVDVAVVVAYGALIPPALLAKTRAGFVNVHFSVLPRWRGAAPVERAILAGDEEVGVSIMVMDEGLDTGPVLATASVPVDLRTGGDLTEELAVEGARLLSEVLHPWLAGSLEAVDQDDALATIAPKLTVDEGRLRPSEGAVSLARRVRALTPRPGAFLESEHGRLVVLDAEPLPSDDVDVGRLAILGDRLVLGTTEGDLALRTVRPAGRRTMDGRSWANGVRGDLGRVE